ncbi:hypothetical protein ACFL3F_05520 [Planctomycetota bacterium]
MKELLVNIVTGFLKNTLIVSLAVCLCGLATHSQPVYAQAVYVDSNTGDDNNEGTEASPVLSIHKAMKIIENRDNDAYVMKINPGLYIFDRHVAVSTEKDLTDKRIVIEAAILPDDTSWTPEKMPIIVTKSQKGEILEKDLPIKDNWIVSFYINDSHVTMRGLKFLGYHYPSKIYYPIARFNRETTDLLVEQCMFVGDSQSAAIQVGIIAHGNGISVNHCVFYNVNNTVVFWKAPEEASKVGNSITNSIIFGSSCSGVWTAWPDTNFVFKNNIVSNCKYAWINEKGNAATYSIDDCIIVNNEHVQGVGTAGGVRPTAFETTESNIIKEGEISLRMIESVFKPIPKDHLHVLPNSLGHDIAAGLFKHKTQ